MSIILYLKHFFFVLRRIKTIFYQISVGIYNVKFVIIHWVIFLTMVH